MMGYKKIVVAFSRRCLSGAFLILFGYGVTAQTPAVLGNEGYYQIKKMRRRTHNAKAIVLGSLSDGPSKKHLAQLAMVLLNSQPISVDSTGHYKQEVDQGSYTIIGRNIFYNNSTIQHIKIHQGDSLNIDFYLFPSQTVN